MNATRFRIFDPLRDEWVAPYPAAMPMTKNPATAAHFDSEAAAVMRGRQLIGPARPWLVFQRKDMAGANCPACG
ncbi:MAG: hypothetical protein HY066_09025 [Betaproteobacteria bacterium]|nr:hypothetical protein [Betaproteobacteria bacterium]